MKTIMGIHMRNPQQQGSPNVTLKRSSRDQRMPNYYGNRVTVVDTSGDPKSWKEAISSADNETWEIAMKKEMRSFHAMRFGIW